MRPSPTLVALVCALAVPVVARRAAAQPAPTQADTRTTACAGDWILAPHTGARPTGSADAEPIVQLSLMRDDRAHDCMTGYSSFSVPLHRLVGLTAASLGGAGVVAFRLEAEAGAFRFDGLVRDGRGTGAYAFTPDARFAERLVQRGVGRPTVHEQYRFAMTDTRIADVDELLRALDATGSPRPDAAALLRCATHGVDARYVRALAGAGHRGLATEEMIRLRNHAVTPAYLAELRDAGYATIGAEQVIRLRNHEVTGEAIRRANARAGERLSVEALVRGRRGGEW